MAPPTNRYLSSLSVHYRYQMINRLLVTGAAEFRDDQQFLLNDMRKKSCRILNQSNSFCILITTVFLLLLESSCILFSLCYSSIHEFWWKRNHQLEIQPDSQISNVEQTWNLKIPTVITQMCDLGVITKISPVITDKSHMRSHNFGRDHAFFVISLWSQLWNLTNKGEISQFRMWSQMWLSVWFCKITCVITHFIFSGVVLGVCASDPAL